MLVVGVDGCKDGWLAISALDGDFREASLFAHLDELVAAFPTADVVAVDIPIGYPQGAPRGADIEARKFVGRRHASVFPTPPRKALIAGNYEDAVTIARALTGRGISRQSFALGPKILEAESVAKADARVIEVHPEVSFCALAGRQLASKKTWQGTVERRALLGDAGLAIPEELGDAGRAMPDDVLDAGAAAWSASRIAQGVAKSLPSPPAEGPGGQRIAIWY